MLSIKKVIHIDLNSLYKELTANGVKLPSTFEDLLTEIYCDELEYGDARSILFNDYTEENEVLGTIQDYLSFYYNIYDNEIYLEMGDLK